VFPTRLLTSKDEYKWYWHKMIYFPETIITINTTIQRYQHIHLFLSSYAHYSLCACWHPKAMKGSSSLTSCRLLILSRLLSSLTYLGSTDAPCSCNGDPAPPSPKWRPHSQGPRTLPYRDPEHLVYLRFTYYLVLIFRFLIFLLSWLKFVKK
jgi:hypothetical protein